jgi:hypothetical protein
MPLLQMKRDYKSPELLLRDKDIEAAARRTSWRYE